MTLQNISNIVEIFSGSAVAVTLVYLAFQLRQSARHQRGTISHSRSSQLQQLMRSASASDELMTTVLRGWAGDETLTAVEVNQFYWFVSALLTQFQDTFHQREDGMVSERMYASARRTMAVQIAQPGTRAAWLLARGSFEPAFASFVDQLMRETPIRNDADVATRWKVLVAEQRPMAAGD